MKKLRLITILAYFFAFVACEEILLEDDISQLEIKLLAPSNNSQISVNNIQFDWRALEGASSYRIQIATPSFGDATQFLLNTEIDTTTTQLPLHPGNYAWRVKGINGGYETPFSKGSFEVVAATEFSENTITLLTPEDNVITNEVSQELSWAQIDGASLYRIQVLNDIDEIVSEETTNQTTSNIQFGEGAFDWQVRGENGSQNTQYARRSLLVDITLPNVPELVSPINETILNSSEVVFEWNRESVAGSVEGDSLFVSSDANFTDLVLAELVTNSFSTTLENDTYYWLMKAFDEAGNESEDSAVFSFTVNN